MATKAASKRSAAGISTVLRMADATPPDPHIEGQFPIPAHPAVARAARAFKQAMNRRGNSLTDADLDRAARCAFKSAMPPLTCEADLADFLACLTYATLHSTLSHFELEDCHKLLQIARQVYALRSRSGSSHGKSPQKSPSRRPTGKS